MRLILYISVFFIFFFQRFIYARVFFRIKCLSGGKRLSRNYIIAAAGRAFKRKPIFYIFSYIFFFPRVAPFAFGDCVSNTHYTCVCTTRVGCRGWGGEGLSGGGKQPLRRRAQQCRGSARGKNKLKILCMRDVVVVVFGI